MVDNDNDSKKIESLKKDNSKKIEAVKKEIDRYSNKTSFTAYSLKGQKLKELFFLTREAKVIDDAIEAYTNAINKEEKSESYCHRADLYTLKGDNDSAVADFKRANEIYEPSGNYCDDLYLKNHLESISQLQGVKDTITKLKEEGKMDPEFLKSYETLTDNVMKVANRVHALELKNTEQEKQLAEMQAQIRELLEQKKQSTGTNEELQKLQKEMDIVVKKLYELSNDVNMLM